MGEKIGGGLENIPKGEKSEKKEIDAFSEKAFEKLSDERKKELQRVIDVASFVQSRGGINKIEKEFKDMNVDVFSEQFKGKDVGEFMEVETPLGRKKLGVLYGYETPGVPRDYKAAQFYPDIDLKFVQDDYGGRYPTKIFKGLENGNIKTEDYMLGTAVNKGGYQNKFYFTAKLCEEVSVIDSVGKNSKKYVPFGDISCRDREGETNHRNVYDPLFDEKGTNEEHDHIRAVGELIQGTFVDLKNKWMTEAWKEKNKAFPELWVSPFEDDDIGEFDVFAYNTADGFNSASESKKGLMTYKEAESLADVLETSVWEKARRNADAWWSISLGPLKYNRHLGVSIKKEEK